MSEQSATINASLSLLRRVDAACLRFEDEWLAGRRPALETALDDFEEGERGEALEELLLLEWTYRFRDEELFTPGEYGRLFPTRREVVERAWQRWIDRGLCSGSNLPPPPSPPVANPLQAGRMVRLAGYEDLTLLGAGGMGEVYKAFDPRLKRWVALKRVRLDQVRPDHLVRFRREAEVLARLAHPHIVKVHGFRDSDGQPVLEMEYVAGGTLEERLGKTPLAPAEAARLVAILAWAVHAAHEKGIVHRDLKPANVLLDAPVAGDPGNVLNGFPKISDFGLAALAGSDDGQTHAGAILGTPAYMSPEQAAGKTQEVGPPTDVWALGILLYRCLTGALPFQGDGVLDTLEQVKTVPVRPPRERCPDVPPLLEEVCLACLHKAPGQRPSAAELAARLERLTGKGEQRSTLLWRNPRPRRRWWAAAALLAAGVLGAAGWLMAGRRPADDLGAGPAGAPMAVSLTVRHYEHTRGADVLRGEIGKEFLQIGCDDKVVIQAELSAEAHCFLIACNTDGKPQLLWPCDEKGRGDPLPPPPHLTRLRYPPAKGGLTLDDDPRGGVQAFLVVASAQPLPSYHEWMGQRGPVPWERLPPAPGVWRSDGGTLDAMELGGIRLRGRVVPLEGQPPLLRLCGWAKGPGIDAVEALAFPVYPREGK